MTNLTLSAVRQIRPGHSRQFGTVQVRRLVGRNRFVVGQSDEVVGVREAVELVPDLSRILCDRVRAEQAEDASLAAMMADAEFDHAAFQDREYPAWMYGEVTAF